jgi:hypothetical protein
MQPSHQTILLYSNMGTAAAVIAFSTLKETTRFSELCWCPNHHIEIKITCGLNIPPRQLKTPRLKDS